MVDIVNLEMRKNKRNICLILLFVFYYTCVLTIGSWGGNLNLISFENETLHINKPLLNATTAGNLVIVCSEDMKTEQTKEFPHDLYHREKEKNGSESKERDEKEIKVQVNINISNETKETDTKVDEKSKETQMFPDPPKDISKNPEDLLWYYLDKWINDDYKAMYGSLSVSARKKYTFQKFYDLYQREREVNGGLESAKLIGEKKQRGPLYEIKVELIFRNENIPNRNIVSILQYTPEGYRINDCGLIPLDYKSL